MGIKPKDTEAGTAKIFVSDQNNPDLFGKLITGKALCLPITIGSTTGGMILQTICAMKAQPAAMLFSETADSLWYSLAGGLLSGAVMIALKKTGKFQPVTGAKRWPLKRPVGTSMPLTYRLAPGVELLRVAS